MADVTWSNTFNSVPTGTDLISEGDNRILDLKNTVRGELRIEHDVGDATVDNDYLDTGRHSSGSARVFFTPAATVPTDLLKPTTVGIWPPTIPELDRLGSSDLDNGRLWVDFDDVQPYVREEQLTPVINWTDLNTNHGVPGAAWLSLWPRQWTTMSSGSVPNEGPGGGDNVRDTISGISAQSIVVPDDGRAYEVHVKAVIKYTHVGNNKSGAFWLEETSPGADDRDVAFYTTDGMSAGADVGGTITLEYIDETVTNGDTYTFDVDMASTDAANLVVNPTSASFTRLAAVGAPYNVTGTLCRLFLTVRPRYLVASYTV